MTVTRRHARAGLAACLVLLVGEMGLLAAAGRSDPPAQPTADPRLDAHGDPLPPGAVARIGTLRWRYLGSVRRVVPSPTGKLAAIEAAKTALMSLADGRVLGEIPRVEENRFGCRFTPDGSRLMVLGGRGVVRFHDPTTGKVVAESRPVREKDTERRDGGRTLTTSHRFTEDARWVATTDPAPEGHTLTLTEVVAGPAARRQVRLEPPPEFGTAAEVFDFACDGATVVGAGRQHTRQSWDPVLFRWDLATGRLTTAVWPKVQENGFVRRSGWRSR